MVNGQFPFEDLPVLVLKGFGAVGLELGLEEWEMEVFTYMHSQSDVWPLLLLRRETWRKVERKPALRKSVMTDSCLEWGDYLKRCGVGKFFLSGDVLLE